MILDYFYPYLGETLLIERFAANKFVLHHVII